MELTKNTLDDFKVGNDYRYSQIPEYSTEEIEVNDYGAEYFGSNAIHIRDNKTLTDVWLIYVGQGNEGIFKCVYKD